MPSAIIDGIDTRFDVIGSGPPLLMMSPGGFDATIEKWRTQGVYTRLKLLDHLPRHYSCIVYDRRESGESGGRVEPITWAHYVAQAKSLLDHLRIARAHVMGACMGCSPAMAFAVAHPDATASLVLYWPVGGAHYRVNGHARVAEHLAYVEQYGLPGVVSLVTAEGKTYNQDPRGGFWASVIQHDPVFATEYMRHKIGPYTKLVAATRDTLFDRDTSPGAEPEELFKLDIPALIVPGRDKSHATSAARYLEECLPRAEYWDIAVDDQTEATVPRRIVEFLAARHT
ncbi:MAG TPA: alpha/beta hydrolase [Vicinamibacterales bacterium]|nr:alpha/beta hydrolase [Vicinamibacterales bacterium]